MYYTYILRSKKDGRLYTGYTKDLRKRFKLHNDKKVASTANRAPLTLIYYEACLDQGDARARERYLKSGLGKQFLNKRLKRFLTSTD